MMTWIAYGLVIIAAAITARMVVWFCIAYPKAVKDFLVLLVLIFLCLGVVFMSGFYLDRLP